jgi:hypothetical protein
MYNLLNKTYQEQTSTTMAADKKQINTHEKRTFNHIVTEKNCPYVQV